MEDLTQRWTQLGPFTQNEGTFFDFQKRAGEGIPPPIRYASGVTRF